MKLTEPFVALHEVDGKDSPPDGLTSVFFCGGRKALYSLNQTLPQVRRKLLNCTLE